MTDKPRRKLRLRRKKRRSDGVDDAMDVGGEFGCCMIEAVFVTTAAVASLAVPAVLLLD